MTEFLFDEDDYAGTSVALASEVWEKKLLSPAPTGHPEVAQYLEDVRLAISQPDIVFQSTRRQDSRLFYRLDVGKKHHKGLHIVVVVKYVQEHERLRGYVSTVYLARKVYSRGIILWKKPGLLTR